MTGIRVTLKSGGFVWIEPNVDLTAMSVADRLFLRGLFDMLDGYAEGNRDESTPTATPRAEVAS